MTFRFQIVDLYSCLCTELYQIILYSDKAQLVFWTKYMGAWGYYFRNDAFTIQ